MDDKQIQISKERLSEALPKLKRDYERLKILIDTTEDALQNATIQNASEYDDKFCEIDDSFECIETFI